MDQQDMTNDDADAAWPDLAADVTLARGAARSITLDTQRASTDGRILDISAQLDQMGSRLTAVEDNLFEAMGSTPASDELLSRLAILGEEVSSISAEFDALATRIAAAEEGVATTMMVSVDGFDSRLAIVEDARLNQAGELNELTSYLEQAFTRIAELAEVIEVERRSNSSLRSDIGEQSRSAGEAFGAQIAGIQSALEELQGKVAEASSAIDSSNDDLTEALAATVSQLDDRMSSAETRLGQIDDITAAIQFLTARAEALETNDADQLDPNVVDHLRSTIDEMSVRIDHLSDERATADVNIQLDGLRSVVDEIVAHRALADDAYSATNIELDAHRVAIDRVNDEAHATRQLTQDVSDRITNMSETFDLIGQRVDLIESAAEGLRENTRETLGITESAVQKIDHIEETVEGLSGKFEDSASALEATRARVDDAEATAQSAHSRIDGSANEIQQRLDDGMHSVDERLQESNRALDQRLESTVEQVTTQLHETTSRVDHRLEDVEQKLDHEIGHAHQRIEPLEARVAEAVEQTSTVASSLDQSIECIEGVVATTADLAGRVEAREDQAQLTDDQVAALNVSIDETASAATHRLDDQEQQIASVDEKVNHLDEKVNHVDETASATTHRLDDQEQQIASVDERIGDLTQHVSANTEHLSATEANLAEQAQHIISTEQGVASNQRQIASHEAHIGDHDQRITSNEQRADAHDERIASHERQIATTEEQLVHIEDRLGHTEAAINDRLVETAGLAEGAHRATVDLDSRIATTVDDRAEILREHLGNRVEEARLQLQLALDESQTSVSESQADLRRSVLERLDVVEQAVESRVGGVETLLQDADISVRMTSLEAALGAADTTATEAYAFTESLRQLQTDIVQALQEELRSHEELIGSTREQIVDLEQAGSQFASAERVHMLEAKLVEALQTISQLTQLQRRNTTVESQLTDTLAATSHGVENTQTIVAGLREELDSAQQRIAHLEQMLSSAAAATPVQATPTTSTPQPAPDDIPSGIAAVADDDADTGWFTESYARKNEPKAS